MRRKNEDKRTKLLCASSNVKLCWLTIFTSLIIETIVKVNPFIAARIIEKAATLKCNLILPILEKISIETLAHLLILIKRAPSTPKKAARLFEKMSLDKAVKIVKIIIELEAFEDLSEILHSLSSNRLNEILERLTDTERAQLLQYLKPDTIARIRPQLLCLPDLIIESIRLSPSKPKVNEECIISVSIANIGQAKAWSFDVAFRINGKTVQTKKIKELKVNEKINLKFIWKPWKQATYKLTIVIDPERRIYELNKENNVFYVNIIVEE